LPGDWIDGRVPDQVRDAPNDRLDDETLAARAEAWRPWRAYGALYLAMAGITGAQLMESSDARCAA
jgi:AraC family transcriptional regulator of adaptative response / DNA-3-methyladenine glycosylase II